jgi:hypothetical protein
VDIIAFEYRRHLLAATAIACSPIVDSDVTHDNSSMEYVDVDLRSGSGDESVLSLLAVATKAGFIFLIQIVPPITHSCGTIKVVGHVATGVHWPICLEWKKTNGTTDSVLLAVGGADGSIHVCKVWFDTGPAQSELSMNLHSEMHLLWPAGDSVPVQCVRWAEFRAEGKKVLAVKGSVIVLLSFLTEKMETDSQSERQGFELVYGIHTNQISGISCTQEGTYYSTATDGSVQQFSLPESDELYIKATGVQLSGKFCDVHSAYQGCVVSSNGVFLFLVVRPDTIGGAGRPVFQGSNMETCLIVVQLARVIDTESLLMDSSSTPFSSWDVLEHLHMSVIQDQQVLPPALFQLCTKSDLSLSQLQIKRAISVIMSSTETYAKEDSNDQSIMNWRKTVESVDDQITMVVITSALDKFLYLHNERAGGEITEPASTILICMCSWLAKHVTDSDSLAARLLQNVCDIFPNAVNQKGSGICDQATTTVCSLSKTQIKVLTPCRYCPRSGYFAQSPFQSTGESTWDACILKYNKRCPFTDLFYVEQM